MTYAERSAIYVDPETRARIDMCSSEQAHLTYANDADASNEALAADVAMGDGVALDAICRAVAAGPNWQQVEDDQALLAAVQESWHRVAIAFHPAGA
jgi:hypothetical protein